MIVNKEDIDNSDEFGLCPCGRGDRLDLQRIPRTKLMKTILFWLTIKRYRCYRCMRNRWILG